VVFFRLPTCNSRNRRGAGATHTVGGVATAENGYAMTEDDVLDEAMDNLREGEQRIRANHQLLRSQGMTDNEDYRELVIILSTALAMTEAARLEMRRLREM
jgi:hypothetical protein